MTIKPTLLVLTALLVANPSYALFGLGGSDSEKKLDTDAVKSLATQALTSQSSESSSLIDSLTSQLDISPEQATGGTSALLALASNSLSGSNASELGGLIPSMDSGDSSLSGLLGMASNMSAVNGIFEQLGLDPAMVSQFTPIILQYLTSEGASSGLMSSLGSIWK